MAQKNSKVMNGLFRPATVTTSVYRITVDGHEYTIMRRERDNWGFLGPKPGYVKLVWTENYLYKEDAIQAVNDALEKDWGITAPTAVKPVKAAKAAKAATKRRRAQVKILDRSDDGNVVHFTPPPAEEEQPAPPKRRKRAAKQINA